MEPSELVEVAERLISKEDITQREFANEIGVAPRTWRRWRDGEREPSGESLRSLTDWVEEHTGESYSGPTDADEDPMWVFWEEIGEVPVGEDPDPSDLTDREWFIAQRLQRGDTVEDLAEEIGARKSVIVRHMKDLRREGWQVYFDEGAEHFAIQGDHLIRSSEHKGTRTRKANRWWEMRHNELVREFRSLTVPDATLAHTPAAEDWVTHMTDLHAGDRVRRDDGTVVYSTDEIPSIIDYITEQSLALADHHNATYDTAHLCWGGDMVTNEGIYEGQFEDLDAWLDEQVDVLHDPLKRQIKAFSTRFDTVNIVTITGNHGEMRASGTSKQANADLLLYKNVRNTISTLQEEAGMLENVRFRIGQVKPYKNFPLRGGRLRGHLRHGHHRKPQAVTSAGRKEWLSTLLDHEFDLALKGHHHISGRIPWDGPPVLVSGSPKPPDEFVESIAGQTPSRQKAMGTACGVSDDGITCVYPIDDRNY